MSPASSRVAAAGFRHAGDYLELCKPKIVALIVFTAAVGMFLSVPGMVPFETLVLGLLGIGLAAGSGAAFNHVLDRGVDRLMRRTSRRPVAAGQVETGSALAFAAALAALSGAILLVFVNWLTAVLTLLSMVGYAVVYTVYLKRMTPQNIVIGGAAGAMPPVLGWTAITDSVDPHALLLFLIIFAWTPPHFWALAIHRRDEYAQADIPMLPVTHGVEFTRVQILLYTLILFVVSLLPYVTRMSGLVYLATAVGFGAGFVYHAVRMLRGDDDGRPMKTFGYSIVYLAGVFAGLLVDHYV